MMQIQQGILEAVPSQARYLSFTLTPGAAPHQALQRLHAVIDCNTTLTGIGQPLVSALGRQLDGLHTLQPHSANGIAIPSTPQALWLWLRGADRGELFHLSRQLQQQLAPFFTLLHCVDGYRYREGRDLTGYEDGTENPQDEEAVAAAIVQGRGAGLDGSSFVAVQQWRHNLDQFAALSQHQQDHTIGRQLSDNEELDAAPASAHIKRTAQEELDPAAFIVRRSMPWHDGSEAGLMFVAFGHSFAAFERLLQRMTGVDDGVTDALFSFTRPINGAYYWCPPLCDGQLDLSALGM